MRFFVFTLGFHEDFVIRRLSRKAAQPGDGLLVVTASPVVGGVQSAYESLKDYCRRVGLSEPELLALDLSDEAKAFHVLLSRLGRVVEPVVADLSGGMRAVCVLTLLALLISGKKFELYVSAEGGESVELYVPAGVTKSFTSLSSEKLNLLREIARSPGISSEALARRLRKSLKTVRNHLWELKAMGLVSAHGRGAPLTLTKWGLVLAGVPA
ncbi:MAG: CRISPR-associated CARF protein Csa3 [Thermofilaceae archaeon]|nr:CRISPR-associated CARF protein Csa3 [Thermofilaceae archaeon]MDW8004969.1 CRISPR-associated CARF protein Csa3 [Thermofilaceae archaeon]